MGIEAAGMNKSFQDSLLIKYACAWVYACVEGVGCTMIQMQFNQSTDGSSDGN